MKAKDFKKIISTIDDNAEIIMAKDGEGNGFTPFSDLSMQTYIPESNWSGEISMLELTPDLVEQGYTDEDVYEGGDGVLACVLWGVN